MTPDAHTIQELFLEVGDGHQLYVQDWGAADATTPIVYLHGGPGSGCSNKHRQSFDPKKQRVIFFDQRGCGRSLPYGSLEHNTTADLVEDIEKIAVHLKLDTFVITGGSWGSCLAFAYALKYPARVKAMALRGIFTGTKEEASWLDNGDFRAFYPDIWDAYLAKTPKSHQANPSKYHAERILHGDEAAARDSGYAYECLEGALLSLDDRFMAPGPEDYDPAGVRIETAYLQNGCFMPDKYILHNAHKLKMPIWLVQGRYDMVCPPITAYNMHQALPNSHLIWTIAGHHGSDRSTYDAMHAILLQLTEENA
ncbi:MAG TPA: alpha/beta fold hydrolase [Candidatus Saccharimonadales bacterium]|nr:alpha/beta fold hydrolase [Candidatus Saccharimonadales bacterium]